MSTKPKILFVVTQGAWGGAQRYVFDIAVGLQNTHDVAVAVGEPYGPHDLQKRLSEHGIRVIQLRHLVRNIRPLHDMAAVFELRSLYTKERPDIVHLNSSKAGIVGSFARTQSVKKMVYTAHGWVFLEPAPAFKSWTYRWLEKITAPTKDAIIVLSQKEKTVAAAVHITPRETIEIIHHGLPPITFKDKAESRATLAAIAHIDTHGTWVGTIASLYPTKGLTYLIEAAVQTPDMHFFIIGEGPDRTRLEKRIKRTHVGARVHLIGAHENAAMLLPAFDVFVLPSVKEGFPYAILEAQAAGLPIIATDVGGVADMKPDILVQPRDTEAITRALQTCAHKPAITRSGVDHFSYTRMLTETSNLYTKLLTS